MEELQNIEMLIASESTKGVFAISLVEKPAIEEDFIALSSHDMELTVTDEDRRIVVGLALVPDKKIFREMKGKKFNIFFSKKTISTAAELFMKRLHQADTTEEHAIDVKGACVIESWIVEDTKNDKSNIFNLKAVEGSWVIMMKIDNDELWEKVKDGTVKGFSIEGGFDGLDSLEQSKQLTDDEKVVEIESIYNNTELSDEEKLEQITAKYNV